MAFLTIAFTRLKFRFSARPYVFRPWTDVLTWSLKYLAELGSRLLL